MAVNKTDFQTNAADFIQTHLYKYVLWYFLLTGIFNLPFFYVASSSLFLKACVVWLQLNRTSGCALTVFLLQGRAYLAGTGQ